MMNFCPAKQKGVAEPTFSHYLRAREDGKKYPVFILIPRKRVENGIIIKYKVKVVLIFSGTSWMNEAEWNKDWISGKR